MQHTFEQQKSSNRAIYGEKILAIKRGVLQFKPIPEVEYVRQRFNFFQEFVVD